MEYDAQQKIALFDSAGPSKVYEFIVMKAAVDPTFKERIMTEREVVLQELGLAALPELCAMLDVVTAEQFETIVESTVVPQELWVVLASANNEYGMDQAKIALADIMIAKGEVNAAGPTPVAPSPEPMPVTGSRPDPIRNIVNPVRAASGLIGWIKRLFGPKW